MSKEKSNSGETAEAKPGCAPATGSLRLYEITALVSYSVVIVAESKEAALKEVETWENAWHDTGEMIGVSNVDVLDVRKMKVKLADWDDEAHVYTPKAGEAIRKAIKRAENEKAEP